MTELIRTRIGSFRSDQAIAVEDLNRENVATHLLPPVRAVEHWAQHICSAAELWEIAHGRQISLVISDANRVALLTPDGNLAALAEARTLGRVAPTQVFLDRNQLTRPPV